MEHFARLAALLLLCLAVSCGGRSAIVPRADSADLTSRPTDTLNAVRADADHVALAHGAAAPDRMRALLQGEPQPEVATELPDFGTLPAVRSTSALADFWTDGAAAQQSRHATVQGTALQLASTANEFAWALYALTGTQAAYQLQHLKIETTGGSFSGDQPGYWVIIGNYATARWSVIDRSTATAYSFSLAGNSAFLSPAKTVYVAILVVDGQAVTVSRVGLEREETLWQSIELDAGPASGVTPAIDFAPNNNPGVAWADSTDGTVTFAICDRTLGFGQPASWVASTAEGNPKTASQVVGTDPESPNAKAQWLDLVIDPVVSLPRISMLYTGLLGANGNTRFGVTALGDNGTQLSWLNWRMAFTDGGFYTSLARDPQTTDYAAVWTAGNQVRTTRNPNDMEMRLIGWTNAMQGQIDQSASPLYFGFGSNWLYPHLRYRNTGNPTVAIRGGYVYYQNDPSNPATWGQILGEAQSLTFGSVAYAPDNTPASAFTFTGVVGQQEMRVVDFNGTLFGTPLAPPPDAKIIGAVDALGETNQIAYLPNGSACVAYSDRSATGVVVKYAQQNGASWDVEVVSPTPNTPAVATDLIFLDLAVDSNGVPAICWEQRVGTETSMMAALRGN